MHVSMMESTRVPFDAVFSGHPTNDDQVRAVVAGRQSNYITNMTLPEIVNSSKNFPLGPDCIITRGQEPDQTILANMDLYWYISKEKGCIECKVKKPRDIMGGREPFTEDAKVIVTRKPRRFEAYCCAICRQNFVTVVQALLHMKAFHRQRKKILIQDENVFHDIERAMEVPPVPLPWYVAKRFSEHNLQMRPSTYSVSSSSEIDLAATSTIAASNSTRPVAGDAETNPVAFLLQAIVREYGKPVHMVLFGKDFTDVTVQFEDKTKLIAHLPDIANQGSDEKTETGPNDKLDFQVQRVDSGSEEKECIVRANNPALAHKLIQMALEKGLAQGSSAGSNSTTQDRRAAAKDGEKVSTKDDKPITDKDDKLCGSPAPHVKLDSRGRPSKTVRFMLGSPDSDDEGSSSASERIGGRDTNSPNTSVADKDVIAKLDVGTPKLPSSPVADGKKAIEDEGLKGVVNQLISTASKGIIAPVDPVAPVHAVTSTSTTTAAREDVQPTPYHPRYFPKNLSVPNLSSMSVPVTFTPPSPIVAASLGINPGMVRVQSWGGGSDSSQRFMLSTYASSSREDLRSSLAIGRSFTYAEKIKLMNKLNDEDTLITQKHVIGAGKLLEAERQGEAPRGRVTSSSTPTISLTRTAEKSPRSPTVALSAGNKWKKMEQESSATSTSKYGVLTQDGRKKRKSKYDVDRFVPIEEEEPIDKKRRRNQTTVKQSVRSSSEGSISDREEEGAMEADDNPPTMLDVLKTSFARRGDFLPAQSTQSIPTSSVLSDSNYYGSGEWANAAMQALRSIQKTANAPSHANRSPEKLEDYERKENVVADEDSQTLLPFVNVANSVGGTNASMLPPFVPVTAVARSEAAAAKTIIELAKQITAEQSHLKHLEPKQDGGKLRGPHSPALSDDEKDSAKGRVAQGKGAHANQDVKKEKQQKLNPRNDSNSKRRAPFKSHVIAERGDSLEFSESVSSSSLNEHGDMVLKFHKNSSTASDGGVDASANAVMDMGRLFSNSVETLMKVRYVEKIGRCRVCGYTLPLDESDVQSMKTHVMEHSLKELLQAGCNGKQLI